MMEIILKEKGLILMQELTIIPVMRIFSAM